MSQDKEREFPPIVAVLAEWEDKNGTLAAVTPDEWMALMGPVSHAAVLQSPRQLRVALATQPPAVQGEPVWIQPDHLQKARIAPFLCRVEPTKRIADFIPLYASPPSREVEPLTKHVIDTAREAMDESYEAGDYAMSIAVPSHIAAALSLALDEYDAAHGIHSRGEGEAS